MYNDVYFYRSEVFNMDHYQEPGLSDNHYEQMPVIQQSQQSQSMMTYDNAPHVSPSIHEDITIQEHQSPQMPVHDAMSNLQLENQIPSTSGNIVDSPGTVRMTRARTRGMIYISYFNVLYVHTMYY